LAVSGQRLAVSPNPLSGATTICYTLPASGVCRLSLYNITGKLLTTLAKGYCSAGTRTHELRTANLPCGIYLLKFECGSYAATEKLVIE